MFVFDVSHQFPRSELYGTISQLHRAVVSIMLNYVEGFARFRPKVKLNFFEIAYGSAKETKYLLFLALERHWINTEQYKRGFILVEEILKMLWSIIDGMEEGASE